MTERDLFEEWFDTEYSNYGNSYKKLHDRNHDIYGSQFVDERYDAYKVGVASRQGEIDELNGCVEGWKSEYNSMCKRFERSQEINKELQKSIDEALEILEYNEYVDSPMQALEILKGQNNG